MTNNRTATASNAPSPGGLDTTTSKTPLPEGLALRRFLLENGFRDLRYYIEYPVLYRWILASLERQREALEAEEKKAAEEDASEAA